MTGKKTYAVAALMILHALTAYAMGQDATINLQEILAALGLSALRAGVKKAEPATGTSLAPGVQLCLALLLVGSVGSVRAATNTQHSSTPALQSPATPFSRLYLDSFLTARTPDFATASYGYGLGIGYQVTKHLSADLRVGHSGFDTRGSGLQDLGGRLVARMPFERLAPYTFLGASYDLERRRWHLQPGGGIELGKTIRLFAEGGLDADLLGRNGYRFAAGVRLRF
jgi:hypothetical protein